MEEGNYEFPYVIEEANSQSIQSKMKPVTVGPKRYRFPGAYSILGPQFYNFEIRPNDIFLVGLPRSGTTWSQETIWLLNNNLDYEKAKANIISDRFPLLDLQLLTSQIFESSSASTVKGFESPLKWLPDAPSPRFIKSHLPLSLLPPKLLDTTKVVYVARDPRDMAVSFYKFLKLMFLKDNIDFKTFWDLFSQEKICWTPNFDHIKEAWALRDHPNLLFVTYEEMSADLPSTLHCLATFFGKQLNDDQMRELHEHLRFENFKKNKAVNRESTYKAIGFIDDGEHSFVRRGKAGGWQDYFDEDLIAHAKKWMAENLAGSDLPFSI
ncbi:unnamed protein product [Leptosia nina]|uniref:Sulfotransferase domain-containing protein n=1 Tax=Leptosia nina TaxID=320188 RepID=A0AAV1JY34_9NEOP